MKRIEQILSLIEEKNELHGKKIRSNLEKQNEAFFQKAESFIAQYSDYIATQGKTLTEGVDCYLKMIDDVMYETVEFMRSGKYSSTSFDEVNARVYNNPDVMEYYMHGLLLSQFLWTHHYQIHEFYEQSINEEAHRVKHYLEVGAGHGFYLGKATEHFNEAQSFTVVDISASSIEMARNFAPEGNIEFLLMDIYKYNKENYFDFITMGEVLEHVEDPVALLSRLNSLLNSQGKVFITTPTNAPAIDHIYLFKNSDDIREVIDKAGFKITKEIEIPSEDVSVEEAHKLKIGVMYAALLEKK